MRLLLLLLSSLALAYGQSNGPLRLQKTIVLPHVQGRIDHMFFDANSGRLFVAALGNNTVEVVDVKQGKWLRSISGLHEPQGILYLMPVNRLYVANGSDGTLRIFDGNSYGLLKTIKLGDDADNVRYDPHQNRIYVGYGSGALAAVNEDGSKMSEVIVDAHPESFQLEKDGPRIFINLPESRKIAVVDRGKNSIVATWGTARALSNFPMSLDEADHRLFVVARSPAELLVLNTDSGNVIETLPAVGDCDDVFYDQTLKRIYATGGEGAISAFQQQDADHYKEIAKVPTVKGARTSFFSPDFNCLNVAVRRQGIESAAIRVYATQK